MKWWEAVVLGIVQGTTEWLPISSSGHLAIAREALGLEASTFYDLMLHVGTLLVVMWVYRRRIAGIVVALVRTPRDVKLNGWKAGMWQEEDRRLAWLVALASIPIGLAGYFLEAWVEAAFTSLRVVGFSLLFTGTFLGSTRRLLPERSWRELGWRGALWIGAWQVLALLPGVSRSGTTIAAGMHVGLERRAAADFGFLLAIPALVGATLFKASDASEAAWAQPSLWVGLVVSGVVGYLTLTTLIGFVARRGLHPFAPYCWVVGVGVLGYAF